MNSFTFYLRAYSIHIFTLSILFSVLFMHYCFYFSKVFHPVKIDNHFVELHNINSQNSATIKNNHDELKLNKSFLTMTIPSAQEREILITVNGTTYVDEFAWMDTKNKEYIQETLEYIKLENQYSDSFFQEPFIQELTQELIDELRNGSNIFSSQKDNSRDKDTVNACRYKLNPESEYWLQGTYVYEKRILDNLPVIYRHRRTQPENCACPYDRRSNLEVSQLVLDYRSFSNSSTSEYFFFPGLFEIEPIHENLAAFSFDLDGSEKFLLYFYNISSQILLNTVPINEVYYGGRWLTHQDNSVHFYYNVIDKDYGTPMIIKSACVAECSKSSDDNTKMSHAFQEITVYEENNPTYVVDLSSSIDGTYIFINSVGQTRSKHIIVSAKSDQNLTVLFQDEHEVKSEIHYRKNSFYILTNIGATNSNKMVVKFNETTMETIAKLDVSLKEAVAKYGKIMIQSSQTEYIETIQIYSDLLVVWYRKKSLRRFKVFSFHQNGSLQLEYEYLPPSSVYSIVPFNSEDLESRMYQPQTTQCIVFSNSSFVQPLTSYSLNIKSLAINILINLNDFEKLNNCYNETLVWAPSRQNPKSVQIPISIAYKKQPCLPRTTFGNISSSVSSFVYRPVYMVAYGAYGGFQDPRFNEDLEVFFNRGFIVATCHPRGDADMGSEWYLNGKYEFKENTFFDVRDCLNFMVKSGLTRPGWIAFKGRSAGGLVAGNVFNRLGYSPVSDNSFAHLLDVPKNQEDEDRSVGAVLAQVAFIDPIYDILDPKIPWTAYEWFEWGNPDKNSLILETMKRYSPYHTIPQNHRALFLPPMLVTGGLHDPRVPYWEPTKWMAKIRKTKKDVEFNVKNNPSLSSLSSSNIFASPILLKISAYGHFATGGEEEKLKTTAENFAFLIHHIQGNINRYTETLTKQEIRISTNKQTSFVKDSS